MKFPKKLLSNAMRVKFQEPILRGHTRLLIFDDLDAHQMLPVAETVY